MRLFLSLSTVVFVLLTGCSSSFELNSAHTLTPPALDGTHAGWQGRLFDLESPRLYVGVQEDSACIYLCVESPDRDVSAAMMRRGLQVEFTPDGNEARRFGFRFQQEVSEIEFTGPDGEPMMRAPSLTAEREYGIAVALRSTGSNALLQCKIPRVPRKAPLGIGLLTTGSLVISLEVPKGRGTLARGVRGEGGEMGQAPGGIPGEDPGGGMGAGPGGTGRRGGGPGGPGGGRPGEGGGRAGMSGETDTVTLNIKMANHE